MFDGLRERLDRLFADQTRASGRAGADAVRAAHIEVRLTLAQLREGMDVTGRALAAERQRLEDAERRGRLAAAVADAETVAVAGRFAVRHRERITLLERKLAVQRDELTLAERELAELAAYFRGLGRDDLAAGLGAAASGADPPPARRPTFEDELRQAEADRRLMHDAVEQQLAYLKKKMGKDKG